LRHAFGAVPEQGRDRTEKQADDRRGDDRAQTDAALRGREIGFDRGRETISLARFLTERLGAMPKLTRQNASPEMTLDLSAKAAQKYRQKCAEEFALYESID